jgi:HK97 family phage major capsid protein
MSLNTTQLRQDRAKVVEEWRKLNDAMLERGEETPEETEKFAKMEKDIRTMEKIIEREENIQKVEEDLAKSQDKNGSPVNGSGGELRFEKIHYPLSGTPPSREMLERRASYAIQGWLRAMKPDAKLEQEHFDAAKFFGFDLRSREIAIPLNKDYRSIRKEYRDMSLTVGSGGYTVPQGFQAALEQALLTFGGVRQVADVIRTSSGNDLPWPTMNDTSNKGAILAEATTFGSSVDPSFGQVIFKAFKYSSKPIIVSNELLQDSAFDLSAMIGGWLGTRIGRIQNDHFTTGAGTTLPKGLTVAAVVGKAAASMTTFTDLELIDLYHSLDPAYRPNATFMFHDTVLATIRKFKDVTSGQYLWQPGLQAGVPDRLLGTTYTINQSMSNTYTTGQKLVLFGDFSKYKIRDAAEIRLVRLDELFAQTDQVGFVAFLRSDGNLLDAGTRPVKWLALA